MEQKDYELELNIKKRDIDALTKKLWRNEGTKENFYSKEWLADTIADAILDDVFYF